jgi:hypothetical protein
MSATTYVMPQSAGITKINVGTLLNVHFTRAVRAHLGSDGTVTDPPQLPDVRPGRRRRCSGRPSYSDQLIRNGAS